jgi:AraC-like DNA-binding protein
VVHPSRSDITSQPLSDYREFPTRGLLGEFVFCLWTQSISVSTEFAQRVLPDGCVDIILMNETPMVVGPWIRPFVAHLAPGTRIVGARCRPGCAQSLLRIAASELLNSSVQLRDILNNAETQPFLRIANAPGSSAKMRALEAALQSRLVKARPTDTTAREAVQWIARNPRGQVEQLSHELGLSDRQLLRRFTAAVGYGPKLFQSVLRFQRLLHLAADAGEQVNLAQLAAEAEFADQPHMTREVHRFSGAPPGASLTFSRSTLALAGLVEAPCHCDA